VNVLSAACSDNFINAIFNNEELSSIEYHADVRVGEVILFIPLQGISESLHDSISPRSRVLLVDATRYLS
jgi:hypothetical protein